jgi:gamma-glutamyltranspeptidase/glutathione hydrolase
MDNRVGRSAVATGHKLTSEAAMEILKAGGNAVDAAIGAYAVACIAEPAMASLAAGGFAMIHFEGRTHCLDFFCQTPINKEEDARLDPIPVDFGTAQEQYYSGIGSVAVPGATKGLYAMHQRFGTLPMKEIFTMAVQLCRSGVVLTPFQSYDLELLHSVFSKEKRGQEIFCHENKLKSTGDVIQMKELANFLEVLAIEGEDLFYKGEIARQIDEISQNLRGHIRYEDLTSYEVAWPSPHELPFSDARVLMPPAPSMGHALMRAFLKGWPEDKAKIFSTQHLTHLLEAGARFKDLLNYQEALFGAAGMDFSGQTKWSGTSHMNICDEKGNAVAMTFSIGEGSGIFLDGSDIHLNNMLGEPSLLPSGLNSWNQGTRLASMMSPTMIFDKEGLAYMMGSGGAERISSQLAQAIILLLQYGLPLEEAIRAPRTYFSKDRFEVEPGFEPLKMSNDPSRYWDKTSLYFGGVHAIGLRGGLSAQGDDRREGHSMIG